MKFQTPIAGAPGHAPPAEAPSTWPVLAQLPHVRASRRAPAEAAVPLADYAPPVAPAAGNPPHIPLADDWPELHDPAAPSRPSVDPTRQYLRVDPPQRQPLRGARSAPAGSFAARAYQWHAALAPHAGVAVTVALILSATFLVWLTLGRGGAFQYDDIYNSRDAWSSEIAPPSRVAGHDVADDPLPALAEPLSSAIPDQPVAGALSEPALTPPTPVHASPQPAAAPPVAALSPARTDDEPPVDDSADVTPTPHDAPYPVTEYVSFDMAPPEAIEQAARDFSQATAGGQEPQ